jgi:hypothetical protein
MEATGDSIPQTGVYRSSCCGSDIAAPRGEQFPLCPGCGTQTSWELLTGGARATGQSGGRLGSQPQMESFVMAALADLGNPALSLRELTADQGLWLARFRLDGSPATTHYLAWHFADDLSAAEIQRRLAHKLRAELEEWKKERGAE